MSYQYKVLSDSREKKGWTFPPSPTCLGTEVCALKTGDYTLAGLEDNFAIERKRSTAELVNNISDERFMRELERLREFEHAFLVCEFNFADVIEFPLRSTIPRPLWIHLKISPQYLLKRINEIELNYGVRVEYVGKYGREFCSSLFKRISEKCQNPPH